MTLTRFDNVLYYLILLFVACMPFSLAGMEIMAWLTIAFCTIGLLILDRGQFKIIFNNPALKPLVFFWLVIILGIFINNNTTLNNKLYIIGEGRFILVFLFFSYILTRLSQRIKNFLIVSVTLLTVVALYAIFQSFTGIDMMRIKPYDNGFMPDINMWRAKGFYSNTMTYSYSFGLAFSFLLAYQSLHKFSSLKYKLLLGLCSVIIGISLVFTYTRGAWIAVFITAFVMSFFLGKRVFWQFLITLIILVSVVYSLQSASVLNRLQSLTTGDSSTQYRLELWRANLAMFKDYPILGVGYRENSSRVDEYHKKLMGRSSFIGHAHNNYLQMLAGTGALGFTFYMWFIGVLFFSAYNLYRLPKTENLEAKALGLGFMSAQLFFHLGGMTESNFIDTECQHFFVFQGALLIASLKNYKVIK